MERSTSNLIYNNKGDLLNCSILEGSNLLAIYEVTENVIEWKLRKETKIVDNQFDLMSKRSTMAALYFPKQYQRDKKKMFRWFSLIWENI